jgi:NAD(P)-dependent dehydrogenase (short-subunit alcohol dehydrogenase family)
LKVGLMSGQEMTSNYGKGQAADSLKIVDLFSVSGKVCLVTGGQRGIGFMIAAALVQNGAKVYISSRNRTGDCDQAANELNQMGPGTAIAVSADLSSDEQCRALAAKIASQETKLHCLVNNAGATWGASFEDFPESAWLKVMTLNVTSVFNLTRALTPLLSAAANGNLDPAKVINISSVGAELAPIGANNPSYLTSKAAVTHLSRYLAATLVHKHITVNTIQPGVYPSKMTADYQLKNARHAAFAASTHPVGRVGTAQDMAGLALFLASRASAFFTGEKFNTDGGTAAIRLPPDPAWLAQAQQRSGL